MNSAREIHAREAMGTAVRRRRGSSSFLTGSGFVIRRAESSKTSREDHPMDAQMRVVHQKLKLFFAEPK
jgi:hypothetical protein